MKMNKYLNPFVFSYKTASHQFSCKIQVLNLSMVGNRVNF